MGIEQVRNEAVFARALYRFTERLQKERSMAGIYDAALDAISDALDCTQVSILRIDSDGRVRTVAWRGVSAAFRLAVGGHPLWRPGDQDPQPVIIDDVTAALLPQGLKTATLEEGFRALLCAPLIVDDDVMGMVTACFEEPQKFTEQEVQTFVTVVRHLGFSIGRCLADEITKWLRAIIESSDDAILTKDLDGVITSWNPGAEMLFGYTASEVIGKPGKLLIPVDRHDEEPMILARIRDGERIHHYETTRQRKDGSLVDISLTVSPIKDADGAITGISKIARDITERRRAEEKQQLLLNEMEHRIKNLFAVASSIVNVGVRSATSPAGLAATVCGRLNALARAHSLTLQSPTTDQPEEGLGTTLHSILRTVLSPYACENEEEVRISINGPDVPVGSNAVTPLALLFYEFATNAVKYGGLSVPCGLIDVRCWNGNGQYILLWSESGGPPMSEHNGEGFGSKLVRMTVAQLNAELSQEQNSGKLLIRLALQPDLLQ